MGEETERYLHDGEKRNCQGKMKEVARGETARRKREIESVRGGEERERPLKVVKRGREIETVKGGEMKETVREEREGGR